MEERNNSKQVLLSIIGIAVLVIAVVGVSFAFFSYSRTGASNNVITTGQIFMNFEEDDAINLTNQFPMLDSEAIAENGIVKGESTEVAYLDFTVKGYYSSNETGAGIDYTVYALDGDTLSGHNRFDDSEVSIFLTTDADTTPRVTNNISSPTQVSTLTNTANGRAIATGKILGGTSSALPQTDSFTLAMFVNDTVRISDTDLSVPFTGATHASAEGAPAKYCASAYSTNSVVTGHDTQTDTDITRTDLSGCQLYYTNAEAKTGLTKATAPTELSSPAGWLPVYNTMYYSLKLKVVGNQ